MKKVAAEKLYIVIPTYNEEDNIQEVLQSWYKQLELAGGGEKSRMVIADSGSTDTTHQKILHFQKQHPELIVLSDTLKEHGPKLIALYKYAIDNGADYIFQTDSDNQTNPNEFMDFWQERHLYDVMIGSRAQRQDGISRVIVSKVICFMLRLFFGVSVPDANTPFRLMKASTLNKYIAKFPQDYAIPNIVLTAYFVKHHEKVAFREVSFNKRRSGHNSINLMKIFQLGWESIKDFLYFRRDMHTSGPDINLQTKNFQTWLYLLATTLALGLFLIVTMYKLDSAPLWFDETVEYWYSKILIGALPFDGAGAVNTVNMYQRIISTYQPPLYNFVMYFWLMFSDSSWWFRFFGVVMGFFAVTAIYKTVKLNTNKYFAVLSILFSSFVYFLLYYWQECAEYCLMMNFLCWTIFYWSRLMHQPNKKDLVKFTVTATLAIYSQYGAIIPVMSMSIFNLLHFYLNKNKKQLVALIRCYLVAGIGAGLPLYFLFLKKQASIATVAAPTTIIADLFTSIAQVFKWSILPRSSEQLSLGVLLAFLTLLLISNMVTPNKRKMLTITGNLTVTWLIYYLLLEIKAYAYGGFGNRYNLFFIPFLVIIFFTAWYECINALHTVRLKNINIWLKTCKLVISSAALLITGLYATHEWQYIKNNWTKENCRDAAARWWDYRADQSNTIVYYAADSGFAYYVRTNQSYDETTENNVYYMQWERDKNKDEYEKIFANHYGESWPTEIYLVASHSRNDLETIISVFESLDYQKEILFDNNASLYRLTKIDLAESVEQI